MTDTPDTPDGPDRDEARRRGLAVLARLGQSAGPATAGRAPRVPGYRILSDAPIGRGQFGEVYLAEDPRLSRTVAVKVLLPGAAGDADQQARLENEGLALARAQGQGAADRVVQIYERTRTTDGRACLVLEYVEGGSLAARLR